MILYSDRLTFPRLLIHAFLLTTSIRSLASTCTEQFESASKNHNQVTILSQSELELALDQTWNTRKPIRDFHQINVHSVQIDASHTHGKRDGSQQRQNRRELTVPPELQRIRTEIDQIGGLIGSQLGTLLDGAASRDRIDQLVGRREQKRLEYYRTLRDVFLKLGFTVINFSWRTVERWELDAEQTYRPKTLSHKKNHFIVIPQRIPRARLSQYVLELYQNGISLPMISEENPVLFEDFIFPE